MVKGTYAHANTAVAFPYIFMAAADGVFGLERHGHVTAVAATGIYLAVLDFGCGFAAVEGCWFVFRLKGFAVETVIVRLSELGGVDGGFLRFGGEGPDVEIVKCSCLLICELTYLEAAA